MQEPILDEVKLFEDIKRVNSELFAFFKEKYDFILSEKINQPQPPEDVDKLIKRFIVRSSEKPIFQKLNGADDIKDLLEDINDLAKAMGNSIDDIVQSYEEQLKNDQVVETIDMISRLVQKFRKALNARVKKFHVDDAVTVDEMQSDFFDLISKILKENLIERIIPAIYEGMKIGNVEIYDLILGKINNFLSAMGIRTLEIEAGQKINYDFCRPTESEENSTDDYRLKEVIKEIRQLPYIFDEDHIVVEGEVIGWRFING